MTNSIVYKTYVRPDNTVVLTCPHCSSKKAVPVAARNGSRHQLKVKCTCKKTFQIDLEYRKNIRKSTKLIGASINHSQNDRSGYLLIHNVSMTGLAFTCFDVKDFREGDELTISFTLDDYRRSEIIKDVTVRHVRQNTVGCTYESVEKDFSPLGYYIAAAN